MHGLNLLNNFRYNSVFVVEVKGAELFVDVEVCQQFARLARVFCEDMIALFQYTQCAQRNVFQVANGCWHHYQFQGEIL